MKVIKKDYPCLGEFENGLVVMFTDVSTGTIVAKGERTTLPVGTHMTCFKRDWKLYDGVINLSNEQDKLYNRE